MVPRPRIPSLPIAGALVAAACLAALPAAVSQQVAPPLHVAGVAPPGMPLPPARTPKPPDAILVASFNIQVFGESKLAKPAVVDVLARVVRHFDVVAIQEVRAKSDGILPTFVQAVNADGSRYQFVLGPRLGRTVSKEQYAFVYDTERIEVDPASVGTVPDPGNRLHRPPLHARFRTRIIPVEMAFTFWLVDIHTDPDEVPQEVDALADVFMGMKSARPDEDDVILLGDLNAAPQQFGRMKQLPNVAWAITSGPTNTHRTKTYDNLVFDQAATREYLGRSGVFDLQSGFGLSLQQALEVSDHCPVWGAFYPAEAPRAMAAGGIAAGAATAPR